MGEELPEKKGVLLKDPDDFVGAIGFREAVARRFPDLGKRLDEEDEGIHVHMGVLADRVKQTVANGEIEGAVELFAFLGDCSAPRPPASELPGVGVPTRSSTR